MYPVRFWWRSLFALPPWILRVRRASWAFARRRGDGCRTGGFGESEPSPQLGHHGGETQLFEPDSEQAVHQPELRESLAPTAEQLETTA